MHIRGPRAACRQKIVRKWPAVHWVVRLPRKNLSPRLRYSRLISICFVALCRCAQIDIRVKPVLAVKTLFALFLNRRQVF